MHERTAARKTVASSKKRIGQTPFESMQNYQGFEGVSAIHRGNCDQIASVGTIHIDEPASMLRQYPSELRVRIGQTAKELLTIQGESDDTYWWSKRTGLLTHSFLLHEDQPRFGVPAAGQVIGGDISRDLRYAAWGKDRLQVADVSRGQMLQLGGRVEACAAGSRTMALAVVDPDLPPTDKRWFVLGSDGRISASEEVARGRAELLAMSWCDALLFTHDAPGKIQVRSSADFEVVAEFDLGEVEEVADILFFGGLLWVAERNRPRITAFGNPEGALAPYERPEPKPVCVDSGDWVVHVRRPGISSWDLGGRKVARVFVDWTPVLVEFPNTPLEKLRKKEGDDPQKLKRAQRQLREAKKKWESSGSTPEGTRRAYEESSVRRVLDHALRWGQAEHTTTAALEADLVRYGDAYEGIAWCSEEAVFLVREGSLVALDGSAAGYRGPLRVAHPAEWDPALRKQLIAAGVCKAQIEARVFRAADLKATASQHPSSIYLLDPGGFARTNDALAVKRLAAGQPFVPNLRTGHELCFDYIAEGVIARWILDEEHGGGRLQFRQWDGTAEGGAFVQPQEVPPRMFSIVVSALVSIYAIDFSGHYIQPAKVD